MGSRRVSVARSALGAVRAALVCSLIATLVTTGVQAEDDGRVEFFENRIRPLLISRCSECHSSQTELSGGLGLDSAEAWQRGGDSGAAITPRDLAGSLVWRAVSYADPLLQMPPDGKLSDAELSDLKRWIEEGAFDPRSSTETDAEDAGATGLSVERAREYWSYRSLVASAPPAGVTMDAIRPSTPIDAFLEETRRQASAPAALGPVSRSALLRRLSFDLHGLPPEPHEIETLLGDERPDAVARFVDRTLASPRFAERMATHWLDVARYAESLTLRGFVLPQAWRYRDYVVNAMAIDLPYDQFIREQIAGDLLEFEDLERRRRGIEALGFLVLGNHNLEEQDKRQLEMDIVDEQLDVIGKALLGQTLSCARCHDHKFDPIPTRDYYAMAGILASTQVVRHANVSEWIERPLPLEEEQECFYQELEQHLARVQEELKLVLAESTESVGEGPLALERVPGIVIDDRQARRVGTWTESRSVPYFVGDGYLHDAAESRGEKTLTFEPRELPAGSYRVRFAYTHGENRASAAELRVFSADGEKLVTIDQRQRPEIDGRWMELGTFRFEPAGQAFVMVSNENADGHVIADAVQFLAVDSETAAVAPEHVDAETSAERELNAELLKRRIAELQSQVQQLQRELASRPKAIGLVERPEASDLAIHVRGSVHRLGEIVPRGFLTALPATQALPTATSQSGRLELAQWMTHPEQALLWRVIANRVWGWTIGDPLVRSVDNFGTTGDVPSHPELLDWLALRLQHDEGSLHLMVRRMVLTDVYARDAGRGELDAETRDPKNQTYWRGSRRRLDAESLRDSMLLVSGELDLRSGAGPLPEGLVSDYGFEHDRPVRSVYVPVFRNAMPSLFEAFDRSVTGLVVGQRDRSTVASQVLTLLNDPWVRQRAESAALRSFSDELEPLESLEPIFRRALGRSPTDGERRVCFEVIAASSGSPAPENSREVLERRADFIQSLFASPEFRFLE